jgi:hypothetical protein
VLPDGQKGELVFTSLTKQAMPVIRYRTRDLTRLQPGTARPMRRMERITGRTDDRRSASSITVRRASPGPVAPVASARSPDVAGVADAIGGPGRPPRPRAVVLVPADGRPPPPAQLHRD